MDLSQLSYGFEDASKQLSSQAKLQMVNLGGDRPMFRLGEALYQGVWQDMVGTELYSNFGKSLNVNLIGIILMQIPLSWIYISSLI